MKLSRFADLTAVEKCGLNFKGMAVTRTLLDLPYIAQFSSAHCKCSSFFFSKYICIHLKIKQIKSYISFNDYVLLTKNGQTHCVVTLLSNSQRLSFCDKNINLACWSCCHAINVGPVSLVTHSLLYSLKNSAIYFSNASPAFFLSH